MSTSDLTNRGLIVRMTPGGDGSSPRTIIVTGIGRSGTTMVAAVLAGLGILSAADAYPATLDDREFLHLFRADASAGIASVIEKRNRDSDVWGFKLPSIHAYLGSSGLRMFRHPHLVVVFRDPVAVAVRHATAEYMDAEASFLENIAGMQDVARFVQAADCPLLLVSYEKAVKFPDHFITALAEFCGVSADAAQRSRLRAIIRPDNPDYAEAARRRYEGNIDGIMEGVLHGWCRDPDDPEPLALELLVDGTPAASFRADLFRQDLRDAAIGNGSCGFAVDLGGLNIAPGSILTIRIAGRNFEVAGSGKPAQMYQR